MKQQKVIGIEREQYLLYLIMYGNFQNIQVPGFRNQSRKGSPSSEKSLRIYGQRLEPIIGEKIREIMAKEKIDDFLSHYENVQNVQIRIRSSSTPNLAFEIDVEFDGEEKPLTNGATETYVEQNQNILEGGSMDGIMSDETDISKVK